MLAGAIKFGVIDNAEGKLFSVADYRIIARPEAADTYKVIIKIRADKPENEQKIELQLSEASVSLIRANFVAGNERELIHTLFEIAASSANYRQIQGKLAKILASFAKDMGLDQKLLLILEARKMLAILENNVWTLLHVEAKELPGLAKTLAANLGKIAARQVELAGEVLKHEADATAIKALATAVVAAGAKVDAASEHLLAVSSEAPAIIVPGAELKPGEKDKQPVLIMQLAFDKLMDAVTSEFLSALASMSILPADAMEIDLPGAGVVDGSAPSEAALQLATIKAQRLSKKIAHVLHNALVLPAAEAAGVGAAAARRAPVAEGAEPEVADVFRKLMEDQKRTLEIMASPEMRQLARELEPGKQPTLDDFKRIIVAAKEKGVAMPDLPVEALADILLEQRNMLERMRAAGPLPQCPIQ
jgi:hypothetical protein